MHHAKLVISCLFATFFDDFFFNFIASPKVQRARINFPLPVTITTDRQQRTMEMKRSQWKMDKFFRPQGYYTLIFDNENQMKLAKSTKLDSVIVERIHLRRGEVEQYWFDHQNGKWRMCAIKRISFSQSVNASFLKFLSRFFESDGNGYIKDPLPLFLPSRPPRTIFFSNRAGRYLGSPVSLNRVSMIARQTSRPMKSPRARGPMG